MMKIILNFKLVLLFVLIAGFISCEKDDNTADQSAEDISIEDIDLGEITEDVAGVEINTETTAGPEASMRKKRCFTPVFPVTIVFPDGTTQEIDSKESMKAAMIDWKAQNPDVDGRPEFQFPIDVTTKDGTTTVNSKEELRDLIKSCKGKHRKRPPFGKCLNVVFPVSLEMPNGDILTAGDKEELKSLLMEWREDNPDAEGRPHLVFPFDVTLKNGTVVTINSKEDLIKVLKKCKKRKGGHRPG